MQRASWLVGILGFLAVVGAVLARQVEGDWSSGAVAAGAVGLALLLAWLFLDRESLARASRSRAVRYGSGATLLVLVAAGVAVALNVLAVRYDQRWDATASKRFTLSPQTLQLLDGLDRDVQVLAFFESDSPEESAFRDLVDGYSSRSSHLKVEFHDPLREPLLAQQFEITSSWGTVVLRSGDDQQRLESDFDEEALTNALLRLTSGEKHRVCFTEEHGEADPDDSYEPTALGLLKSKLEGQNYEVEKFAILSEGGVPERCDVVVVAAPQVELLPVEREALARYLRDGGAVLYLLEPLSVPKTAEDLSRYGLSLQDDLVIEDNPNARQVGLDPSFLVVGPDQLDFHPITTGLDAGLLFQAARSVARAESVPDGLHVQELIHTTDAAWAETTLDRNTVAQPDEGQDIVGNVPLAAAVEIVDPADVPVREVDLRPSKPLPLDVKLPGSEQEAGAGEPGRSAAGEAEEAAEQEAAGQEAGEAEEATEQEGAGQDGEPGEPEEQEGGRLVVIGDSSFASNQLLLEGQNQDLVLNAVAWLVGQEDQLTIRPNEASRGSFTMTLSQGILVWFLSLLAIPGLAVAGALSTWLRRRSL